MNLEDCSGCGLSGWGWQDTGYGTVKHLTAAPGALKNDTTILPRTAG